MQQTNIHQEISTSSLENTPFFSYSDSLPALLQTLHCTLAISTYQAGKLILVSSFDGKHLRLFGKNFKRPMGIALSGNKLAIANKFTVEVFSGTRALAMTCPEKPRKHDFMFVPQATYHTGFTDIHDIAWGDEGLWAVNTAFSCLSLMDDEFHFTPKWQPPFISELQPEDRCHLNGLAIEDGKPAYVTLLGATDTKEDWREKRLEKGMVIDVRTKQPIVENLPMPHSPRMHESCLYFLLSAVGKVLKYDPKTGTTEEVCQTGSFVRGLDVYENCVFVGESTIRESSRSFAELPVANTSLHSGVRVFGLHDKKEIARLVFSERIHEIFDVKILPGIVRPTVVGTNDELAERCILLPDGRHFWFKEATD